MYVAHHKVQILIRKAIDRSECSNVMGSGTDNPERKNSHLNFGI